MGIIDKIVQAIENEKQRKWQDERDQRLSRMARQEYTAQKEDELDFTNRVERARKEREIEFGPAVADMKLAIWKKAVQAGNDLQDQRLTALQRNLRAQYCMESGEAAAASATLTSLGLALKAGQFDAKALQDARTQSGLLAADSRRKRDDLLLNYDAITAANLATFQERLTSDDQLVGAVGPILKAVGFTGNLRPPKDEQITLPAPKGTPPPAKPAGADISRAEAIGGLTSEFISESGAKIGEAAKSLFGGGARSVVTPDRVKVLEDFGRGFMNQAREGPLSVQVRDSAISPLATAAPSPPALPARAESINFEALVSSVNPAFMRDPAFSKLTHAIFSGDQQAINDAKAAMSGDQLWVAQNHFRNFSRQAQALAMKQPGEDMLAGLQQKITTGKDPATGQPLDPKDLADAKSQLEAATSQRMDPQLQQATRAMWGIVATRMMDASTSACGPTATGVRDIVARSLPDASNALMGELSIAERAALGDTVMLTGAQQMGKAMFALAGAGVDAETIQQIARPALEAAAAQGPQWEQALKFGIFSNLAVASQVAIDANPEAGPRLAKALGDPETLKSQQKLALDAWQTAKGNTRTYGQNVIQLVNGVQNGTYTAADVAQTIDARGNPVFFSFDASGKIVPGKPVTEVLGPGVASMFGKQVAAQSVLFENDVMNLGPKPPQAPTSQPTSQPTTQPTPPTPQRWAGSITEAANADNEQLRVMADASLGTLQQEVSGYVDPVQRVTIDNIASLTNTSPDVANRLIDSILGKYPVSMQDYSAIDNDGIGPGLQESIKAEIASQKEGPLGQTAEELRNATQDLGGPGGGPIPYTKPKTVDQLGAEATGNPNWSEQGNGNGSILSGLTGGLLGGRGGGRSYPTPPLPTLQSSPLALPKAPPAQQGGVATGPTVQGMGPLVGPTFGPQQQRPAYA